MPKLGYTVFTVKVEDANRLLEATKDLLKDSPVKADSMSPAEQLRLLLDEHDRSNVDPDEEL